MLPNPILLTNSTTGINDIKKSETENANVFSNTIESGNILKPEDSSLIKVAKVTVKSDTEGYFFTNFLRKTSGFFRDLLVFSEFNKSSIWDNGSSTTSSPHANLNSITNSTPRSATSLVIPSPINSDSANVFYSPRSTLDTPTNSESFRSAMSHTAIDTLPSPSNQDNFLITFLQKFKETWVGSISVKYPNIFKIILFFILCTIPEVPMLWEYYIIGSFKNLSFETVINTFLRFLLDPFGIRDKILEIVLNILKAIYNSSFFEVPPLPETPTPTPLPTSNPIQTICEVNETGKWSKVKVVLGVVFVTGVAVTTYIFTRV